MRLQRRRTMMSDKHYHVGYAKPPVDSQFKKGVSGNAKGRPKGKKNFVSDFAEEMSEMVAVNEKGRPPRQVTKQRALIKALLARAVSGDMKAYRVVLGLMPQLQAEQDRLANEAAHEKSEVLRQAVATAKEVLDRFAAKREST